MTGEQTQRAAFEKWIDEPRPEPLQQRHAWDDCRDAFYAGWLAAQAQRAPGSEAERAIFEKWSTGMGLYRHHGLEVRFDDAAWAVWQARAAIATHQTSERQPEPVAFANARDLESMLDGQFGSLLAFRYKTAERSAALYAAPPVQAPFDATAEPIWDQLTKIGESAPPGVWASVQAPADAPLYCPKCEKRLTFGDLTEPRPAQATDGGQNPYYEGLFDGEPEELRALRLRLVAERDAAQAQRAPEGWKLVPEAFLRGFRTLAHNYSLTAIPPDYYCGTEGDAFKDAFRRCGEDLAQLRAMLAASPTPPEAP